MGAFNAANLEGLESILRAEELGLPAIAQFVQCHEELSRWRQ